MTKGQVEAEITQKLTQFEREHLGRGPKHAKTFLIEDMIVVRLAGILSQAEKQLSEEVGGTDLIKQMRSRLIEGASDTLKNMVQSITGVKVVTLHTDISSKSGERIFIFVMEQNVEALF